MFNEVFDSATSFVRNYSSILDQLFSGEVLLVFAQGIHVDILNGARILKYGSDFGCGGVNDGRRPFIGCYIYRMGTQ